MIGKVSPLDFKNGRLCGILGLLLLCSQRSMDLLHTYPLVGIRAFVARIYRDLWFVWSEGERNLLAKDETLCLCILKRKLRKSEQS